MARLHGTSFASVLAVLATWCHSTLAEVVYAPDTVIIATSTNSYTRPPNLFGDPAILGYYSDVRFDGGIYHGAPVSVPSSGYTVVHGGTAVVLAQADHVVIRGGEFVGGSVITNNVPLDRVSAGAAISASRYAKVSIYGGRFVGGVVSATETPTPEELANRQASIEFSSDDQTSLDIYGGEFVGKVFRAIGRESALRINGRNMSIDPPLVTFPNPTRYYVESEFTISGEYLDGTPFSINVETLGVNRKKVQINPTSIAFGSFVPEPGGGTLILSALALLHAHKRNKAKSPAAAAAALRAAGAG
ncbi:MAG: hypothetical protein IT424_15190 [Pirellulales bacterium]|nr:hypothetical protein [Pirellulales bacterium]